MHNGFYHLSRLYQIILFDRIIVMVKKSSQQGSNIDIEIAVCHGRKNGSSHVVDPTGIAVKTVNCFTTFFVIILCLHNR